jgi:hypothetical protein
MIWLSKNVLGMHEPKMFDALEPGMENSKLVIDLSGTHAAVNPEPEGETP